MDDKLSPAPIPGSELERYIREWQTKSFLEKNDAVMREQNERIARADRILGSYANAQNFLNTLQNLLPSPVPKMQARIPAKPVQTQNFNPLSLAVVPAFMKLRRREAIKKEMDAGNIYDKSSRIDPDEKQISGITDKVKEKRAEVIGSWNPEYQKLIRYQSENVPDGVSAGRRGGIFYTPNYDNTMYKGGGDKDIGSEGGNTRIQKTKKINNPLILYRDAGEFIGQAALKKLFGTDNISLQSPQTKFKIDKNYNFTTTPLKTNKYPKWVESTLKNKHEANKKHEAQNLNTPKPFPEFDWNVVNQENIVNEAARRAGYDAVLALRKKQFREKSIIDNPILGNFSMLDLRLKPVAVYEPPTYPTYKANKELLMPMVETYIGDLKNKYTTKQAQWGRNFYLNPTELEDFLAPSKDIRKKYVKLDPPYTATQLVELDAAREKEKIAQRIQPVEKKEFQSIDAYNPISFKINSNLKNLLNLGLPINSETAINLAKIEYAAQHNNTIKDLNKHFSKNPNKYKESVLLKDLFGYHPTFVHGPYSTVSFQEKLVKKPNPLPKPYEEILDEILKQKLIKYKKESKPK